MNFDWQPGHSRPACGVCAHRRYLLTCAEYDELAAEYKGHCGICDVIERSRYGWLVIDHDPFIADWAVRGLLCTPCNTRISVGYATTEAEIAYLADPWYLRRLAVLGLGVEPPAEPPVGVTLCVRGRPFLHTADGWECQKRNGPRGALSWTVLHKRLGPLALPGPALQAASWTREAPIEGGKLLTPTHCAPARSLTRTGTASTSARSVA
jgi:hypothetical protein